MTTATVHADLHRWRRLARRRWRRAAWIGGDPPPEGPCWALIAPCGGSLTVTLWPSLEAAEQAKVTIDSTGCCGGCRRWLHRIHELGVDDE